MVNNLKINMCSLCKFLRVLIMGVVLFFKCFYLRANSYYGEEAHLLVKLLQPKAKLLEAMVGKANKMEKQLKKTSSSSSLEAKFLAQET
jgi:hypothetical protein